MLHASDDRIYKIQVDDNLHFWPSDFGCSYFWYNFSQGTHYIQWWYEQRDSGWPTVEIQPWPVIVTPACAGTPINPPDPTPYKTDNATFLSHITLPDGTVVSPGQSLTKTWRVRNSGTSTWNGYKLIFLHGDRMDGTSPVSIPTTAKDQEVNISVSLKAPDTSGNKVGSWQIVNRDGVHVPGGRLSVNINVVSQTSNDHVAAFSASPASPSNASAVRFYARVNWWSQFRAMRVRVDNQSIGETADAEYTFNWDTSSFGGGDHTLVLEVADQTDTAWSHPERRVLVYTLQGNTGTVNHAPNRPSPKSPYDWYVYYSGNTAQLCAQANGDPDGDAISGYYFDVYESAQLWNSGWASSSCVTTGALGPYNYQWRVKVKDSRGLESEWSDTWHFTLVNPNLSISDLHFEPQDGNSERVKVRVCTTGQGGVGITLRVSVNEANDGSGNGKWNIVGELGVPCFNDIDAPIWNTLEYGDGQHRVRAEAHGVNTGWNGATVREEVYTLPHRRPASTQLLAPIPASGNLGGVVYLNSRTITFRWQPTIRASNYTLHVGASPSPKDASNPIFRRTFDSNVTEHTVTFSQDYATLFWQVTATNDAGTNASGDQGIGIDRVAPSCAVQALPAVTYDSVFQVTWSGSDGLAGVRTFDIQYLDSGRSNWTDWLLGIPAAKTYEIFTGQPGHTYSFRCRATDNANNVGNYPTNADTSTKVDPASRPPTPWWNSAYTGKRNLTILNNAANTTLPAGYPVNLRFDGAAAAEIYNASQSSPKCNDLRIVYNDTTELNRVVQSCTSSAIDIWFRSQVSVAGGASNNTAHQLYYGNASAGAPPADPNQVWYPYREGDTAYLYFFQEGSGSTVAYDSSGNGRNCSIDPSVQWTLSKFGNGVQFNRANAGNSRSLTCTPAVPLTSFTTEFWIKADPNDPDGRVAGQLGSGGQLNWVLSLFERRMRLDVWPCPPCGSSEVRSDFNLNDAQYAGRWNHVAVTFNGGNEVKFYINGTLNSTKYLSQSGINTYSPPLEIGSVEGFAQIKASLGAFRISNGVKASFPYGAFAAITNEPTAAVGTPIAPPVAGSPDLAVLSLTTYPNPSGGVLVQSVVQNQGNRETQNGFFIDLYANHQPTGVGDYSNIGRFWVASPIAAGTPLTLTTVLTNTTGLSGARRIKLAATTETTSTLYIQADSSGALTETTKGNNISGGVQICTASADSLENDNTAASAKTISIGSTQTHNFDAPGDQDWVKFTAQSGTTYTIQTSNLGANADTYLYLYSTDGSTLLASNDDYGGTLASRIDWQAPASGTYYVMVKHWNPNVGGCETSYDLSVNLATGTNPLYLPLILR